MSAQKKDAKHVVDNKSRIIGSLPSSLTPTPLRDLPSKLTSRAAILKRLAMRKPISRARINDIPARRP